MMREAALVEYLAEAVSQVRDRVRRGNAEGLRKEVVAKNILTNLPEGLRVEGRTVEVTADNWVWGGDESLFPDFSASIAIVERDADGQMRLAATAPVFGEGAIVASPEIGVAVLLDDRFTPVRRVSGARLREPPRICVFGQKSKDHWVPMNEVIRDLNAAGIRTVNDCGPFYGLWGYFQSVVGDAIVPLPVAYIEPYNTKPKEELMAFVVKCLNQFLPERQTFGLTTMSGRSVFSERGLVQASLDSRYGGTGFIIAPNNELHGAALAAFEAAVLGNQTFTQSKNEKMAKLVDDLKRIRS